MSTINSRFTLAWEDFYNSFVPDSSFSNQNQQIFLSNNPLNLYVYDCQFSYLQNSLIMGAGIYYYLQYAIKPIAILIENCLFSYNYAS